MGIQYYLSCLHTLFGKHFHDQCPMVHVEMLNKRLTVHRSASLLCCAPLHRQDAPDQGACGACWARYHRGRGLRLEGMLQLSMMCQLNGSTLDSSVCTLKGDSQGSLVFACAGVVCASTIAPCCADAC